ncbi:DoxX family protein [Corynebacterium auriscanis]|uniref:DoxX family protein n=1 Tax=Corynebacterium auriscanis TaxID=99807 RepID=UPI003CE77030
MLNNLLKTQPERSFISKAGSVVGRAAVMPLFIIGAQNALKNIEGVGGMADSAAKKVGLNNLPVEGKHMATINAYAQMGLGSALALGIFPQLSALGLVGSLIPTTLVGHAFWDQETEEDKGQQQLQFVKNLAVIGGLLYLATRDNKH